MKTYRIYYNPDSDGGNSKEEDRYKPRSTALGRKESASWSREARRKFNEVVKAGAESSDVRITNNRIIDGRCYNMVTGEETFGSKIGLYNDRRDT